MALVTYRMTPTMGDETRRAIRRGFEIRVRFQGNAIIEFENGKRTDPGLFAFLSLRRKGKTPRNVLAVSVTEQQLADPPALHAHLDRMVPELLRGSR